MLEETSFINNFSNPKNLGVILQVPKLQRGVKPGEDGKAVYLFIISKRFHWFLLFV